MTREREMLEQLRKALDSFPVRDEQHYQRIRILFEGLLMLLTITRSKDTDSRRRINAAHLLMQMGTDMEHLASEQAYPEQQRG